MGSVTGDLPQTDALATELQRPTPKQRAGFSGSGTGDLPITDALPTELQRRNPKNNAPVSVGAELVTFRSRTLYQLSYNGKTQQTTSRFQWEQNWRPSDHGRSTN